MQSSTADVTTILNRVANGDPDAASQLVPLVYEELRKLARSCLRRERADHTLQSTALVHEAYLRLAGERNSNWESRAQFFAVAANAMRHILVDYARAQIRKKRGGKQQRVPMDAECISTPNRSEELLAIHESLARLEQLDYRQAKVVELRYFGGLTFEEVSEVLGISSRTVKREWNVARAWLFGQLKDRHADHVRTMGKGQDSV